MKRIRQAIKSHLQSSLGPLGFLLIGVVIFSIGCGNFVAGGDINVGVQAFRDYMPKVSQVVPLGEAASVKNLAVTVTRVRASDGRGDGPIPQPPPDGYQYLLVGVELENQGDKQELISSRMSFSLFDSLGHPQEWVYYAAAEGPVDGQIDPGLKRRGELSWKVKVAEDAEDFMLVFGDVAFSLSEATGYQPGGPE